MLDPTIEALIISNESLKLRVSRLEEILLNFEGVVRDADGRVHYKSKTSPITIPETEAPIA